MKADLSGYSDEEVERNAQGTAREEGWMLSEDLLAEPLPPVVKALRTLDGDSWAWFVEQLNPENMKFFNHETSEFNSSLTWRALLESEGLPVCNVYLSIPASATEEQSLLIRQIRNKMHSLSVDDEFGFRQRVFNIDNVHRRIMVIHKSPMARTFFLKGGEHYEVMVEMLALFGYQLTEIYATWSRIDPIK